MIANSNELADGGSAPPKLTRVFARRSALRFPSGSWLVDLGSHQPLELAQLGAEAVHRRGGPKPERAAPEEDVTAEPREQLPALPRLTCTRSSGSAHRPFLDEATLPR